MNIEASGSSNQGPRRDAEAVRSEKDRVREELRKLEEKARHSKVSDAEVKELEDRIYELERELAAMSPTNNEEPVIESAVDESVPAQEDAGTETSTMSEAEAPVEGPRIDTGPNGDIPVPVPGVNPDRVRFMNRPEVVGKVVEPARTEVSYGEVRRSWGRPVFEWARNTKAGRWFWGTLAAAGIMTAATNITNEQERGAEPTTTTAESVRQSLDTIDMETMARQIQDEACRWDWADLDSMHRFTYRDAEGNDRFNPGGFLIPMAVELTEHCRAKVNVRVDIPYHLANTFSEILVRNPERREEIIQRLSRFITQQVQDRLEVRGLAGVTGTSMVYDRAHNRISSTIDLGRLDISDMTVTGEASAEAEASRQNAGVPSLTGANPENVRLAHDRLADSMPLIREAFERAGVSPDVLENIREVSYERDLVDSQVHELAQISRQVLGESVTGTDAELAYELVQEVNAGNPQVRATLDRNPAFAAKIREYIDNNRGVEISFEAETTRDKTTVYNVAIPWPLFLLMLPLLKIGWRSGLKEVVRQTREVPAVWREELVDMPKAVARRLFSETTPAELDKERRFEEVYDSINLGENPRDTHLLLEHMLIEEVEPSLYEETKEPMIDYEEVVNAAREYLRSDTRKGEVSKGSYSTVGEAERKTAEMLLSMWERHDAATYPMEGIDLTTVLNYRHAPHVVYWAKTLAEFFVSHAERTTTREEFRQELTRVIDELRANRTQEGGVNRNLFVQSETPLR